MQIRSVMGFLDVSYPVDPEPVVHLAGALHAVGDALTQAGYVVQSIRLATQPFPEVLAKHGPQHTLDLARDLASLAVEHGISFVALGPARLSDPPGYLVALADTLGKTDSVFGSVEIASPQRGISLPRLREAAQLISRVAHLQADGFKNLFLTASANVGPWAPFLPAAYHGGGPARIAIATESADLAVEVSSTSTTLQDMQHGLVTVIEREASRVEAAARQALKPFSEIDFAGIDFSLAPYPETLRSIGRALENLGASPFGIQGSLFAAAFMTDALDQAQFTRTGFCGLMLPVLEDNVLAQRAAEGVLRITELLAFSAVCGTGLDLLALPGDTPPEALVPILLDVAVLALRLDKPLTARLMPLPGMQAGDPVTFDFEYFANSRVLEAPAALPDSLLAGQDTIRLSLRRPRR